MTPEQLIADLQKQIAKLQEDLAISEENVKDFEHIAATWKKSYGETEKLYKKKLGDAEQFIEQLEKDLKEAKANAQER